MLPWPYFYLRGNQLDFVPDTLIAQRLNSSIAKISR